MPVMDFDIDGTAQSILLIQLPGGDCLKTQTN